MLVGCGGSACTDAGLAALSHFDPAELDELTCLCDVSDPFLGALRYAPQKGRARPRPRRFTSASSGRRRAATRSSAAALHRRGGRARRRILGAWRPARARRPRGAGRCRLRRAARRRRPGDHRRGALEPTGSRARGGEVAARAAAAGSPATRSSAMTVAEAGRWRFASVSEARTSRDRGRRRGHRRTPDGPVAYCVAPHVGGFVGEDMFEAFGGNSVVVSALLALPAAPAKDYADDARNIIPSGQYGADAPPGARHRPRCTTASPRSSTTSAQRPQHVLQVAKFGVGTDGPRTDRDSPRPGRHHHPRQVQRAAHQRRPPRRRHLGGRLDRRRGPRPAASAGPLQRPRRGDRRPAPQRDRPDLRPAELRAERADRRRSSPSRPRSSQKRQRRARQSSQDIDTYITGINAYLAAKSPTNAPWTRNDVYAVNALKGQFLGEGGGDEARRSQFLGGLQEALGSKEGLKVFNDLRQHDQRGARLRSTASSRTHDPEAGRKGSVDPRPRQLRQSAASPAALAELNDSPTAPRPRTR